MLAGEGDLDAPHLKCYDIFSPTGLPIGWLVELVTQFGPDFVFAPDDDVYVCGSNKATRLYGETFPQD